MLLLSYWLQSHDLAGLSLFGDSAYSVYSANQTLLSIATTRVRDGHPPLYYYLLHFWIQAGGDGELSVRLLAVCFGMAGVAAAYALGRQLAGPPLGLLAAMLLAFSPELVYDVRLVRMYAGLACLALISTYLFLRLLKRPTRL
ncbi:MAG: glycosyltransferase family 39 protein, partial [Chloroflexota bacterium]|nr:glycosyltransferase family 39 protein [Chloroflexota bacterium]